MRAKPFVPRRHVNRVSTACQLQKHSAWIETDSRLWKPGVRLLCDFLLPKRVLTSRRPWWRPVRQRTNGEIHFGTDKRFYVPKYNTRNIKREGQFWSLLRNEITSLTVNPWTTIFQPITRYGFCVAPLLWNVVGLTREHFNRLLDFFLALTYTIHWNVIL